MIDKRFNAVGNLFLVRDREITKKYNEIKNQINRFKHLKRTAETDEDSDYYDGVISGLSIAEIQLKKYIDKFVKFEEV